MRTAIVALSFVAVAMGAFADGESEQITIWHQFYFEKGLDYNQFAELGSSRDSFRRVFVEEILAMQERGASATEAAAVLLVLDSHYLDTLTRSARGLEASFAAEFRAALVSQYERLGKSQRIVVTDGAFMHDRASAHTQQAPDDINLIATGTWSNIDGNNVRVTVDFTQMDSGHLISFSAQGNVPEVATDIAFQLFDYFEKHRHSQPKNPLPNLEVRPALPGHLDVMGVTREAALSACQGQGYRLPYSYEMNLIFAQGPYEHGGIEINPGWYYHVADDPDHLWLAPGKLEHVKGTSLANFEKRRPYYIMVKGTPSPNVQTLLSLKSALRAEYSRPESERNVASVYAVRLVLNDFDSNHHENDVALRTMNHFFEIHQLTPAQYLASRGFTLNIRN